MDSTQERVVKREDGEKLAKVGESVVVPSPHGGLRSVIKQVKTVPRTPSDTCLARGRRDVGHVSRVCVIYSARDGGNKELSGQGFAWQQIHTQKGA